MKKIIYIFLMCFAVNIYSSNIDVIDVDFFLGKNSYHKGDYQKALYFFDKVILESTTKSHNSNKSKMYLALILSLFDPEKSIDYVTNIINVSPDDASNLEAYCKFLNAINVNNKLEHDIKYVLFLNSDAQNMELIESYVEVIEYIKLFNFNLDNLVFKLDKQRLYYTLKLSEYYFQNKAYVSAFNSVNVDFMFDSIYNFKYYFKLKLFYYRILNEMYLDQYIKCKIDRLNFSNSWRLALNSNMRSVRHVNVYPRTYSNLDNLIYQPVKLF